MLRLILLTFHSNIFFVLSFGHLFGADGHFGLGFNICMLFVVPPLSSIIGLFLLLFLFCWGIGVDWLLRLVVFLLLFFGLVGVISDVGAPFIKVGPLIFGLGFVFQSFVYETSTLG